MLLEVHFVADSIPSALGVSGGRAGPVAILVNDLEAHRALVVENGKPQPQIENGKW
jgi:hypothetical protein